LLVGSERLKRSDSNLRSASAAQCVGRLSPTRARLCEPPAETATTLLKQPGATAGLPQKAMLPLALSARLCPELAEIDTAFKSESWLKTETVAGFVLVLFSR